MHSLLSYQTVGGLTVFFLFCLLFLVVHVVKLARLGWLLQKKEHSAPKQPETEQKPTEKEKTDGAKKPQPIYYIVERKKRPPKRAYHYEEPKSIRFE